MVFNLSAGCREIHQASVRKTVQGPESSDRKDRGSFPGEVGASGRGLLAGLIVKENMTLPIVGRMPRIDSANRRMGMGRFEDLTAVNMRGQITLWAAGCKENC